MPALLPLPLRRPIPETNCSRGDGLTGAEGTVTFRTITPGCCVGRYPYMPFEVYPSLPKATDGRNSKLRSRASRGEMRQAAMREQM